VVFSAFSVVRLESGNLLQSLLQMGSLLQVGYYLNLLVGLILGIGLMDDALNLPDGKN
jgi:hypothetical protein